MAGHQTRRKLFYGFVLLFLVTAPLALLYTAGYRWSPQSGLLKTGTLLLATTPRGAVITVDGHERSDRSPSIVKRLRPGTHAIRMELSGHQPWEKTIIIKSGETSFAEAVVLFSSDAPSLAVPRAFRTATLSPNAESIAWLTTESDWTEVWVTTIDGQDARLVYRAAADTQLSLLWDGENHVILSNKAQTLSVDVRDGSAESVASPVTLLDEETATIVRSNNGSEIARLPKGTYHVVDVRSPYILLEQPSQSRILLLDESDKTTPIRLVEPAHSWEWIGPHTLLYADTYAISLYNTDVHRSTTLTRLSQPLQAVHWTIRHPGYVFYATQQDAYAIEINGLGHRLITSLGSLQSIDDIGIASDGRTLFFVGRDTIDSGLFSRPLFHRDLPEQEPQQPPEIDIQERIHDVFQEEPFNLLRFNPANHLRQKFSIRS